MKIGIIDYNAGNLQSVRNAVKALGFEHKLVKKPVDLREVEQLVFPGVGAFRDSVTALHRAELFEPVQQWLAEERPYLGICLGYQLLFEASEESPEVKGLGHFKGQVTRFPRHEAKVPQMGWNDLARVDGNDPIWRKLPEEPYVYFVHSFFPQPEDESLVAMRTTYGSTTFASGVRAHNLCAVQFHPEKSQSVGLGLMENFFRLHASV